jgi:hypothetical protein
MNRREGRDKDDHQKTEDGKVELTPAEFGLARREHLAHPKHKGRQRYEAQRKYLGDIELVERYPRHRERKRYRHGQKSIKDPLVVLACATLPVQWFANLFHLPTVPLFKFDICCCYDCGLAKQYVDSINITLSVVEVYKNSR